MKEQDFEKMNLDEIRFLLAHGDGILTPNIFAIIDRKISEENRKKNPLLYEEAERILALVKDPHNPELPCDIDKSEILTLVTKKYTNEVSFYWAQKYTGVDPGDPVDIVNNLKIYSLLINYLKNDLEVDKMPNDEKTFEKKLSPQKR